MECRGILRWSAVECCDGVPALHLETLRNNPTGRDKMPSLRPLVSDCHIRRPSIKVLSEISLISSVSRGGWDESTDLITKQLSLAIHSIDLFTSVLLSCNCNENDQNA